MAGAEPLETLRALERLGVRLVLDDFGTGYSSLSYLQRFPLHTLKLDRSFVSALGSNGGSPIVGAVVSMARALGLTVVAEGIETPEQLAQVRRLGCHQAQGYLLAAPGSREEIEQFLTCSLELGPEAATPGRRETLLAVRPPSVERRTGTRGPKVSPGG